MRKTFLTLGVVTAATFGLAAWQAQAQPGHDHDHAAHAAQQQPAQEAKRGQGSQAGMQGMKMSPEMMARCQMIMGTELSPRDPGAVLALRERLELTEEQVQRLEALRDEVRQQTADILTDEQRAQLDELPQQPASMMAMHQQMMQRMHGGDNDQAMQGCPMMRMMRHMHGGDGMMGEGGMMGGHRHGGPATQPAE